MHAAFWIGHFLAGLSVSGPPSVPAWSPDGRWLAYVQEVRTARLPVGPGWLFSVDEAAPKPARRAEKDQLAAMSRLWTTRPDTGESVLLEETTGLLTAPCWDRDGTRLAFGRLTRNSDGSTRWEIILQDAPDHRRVVLREALSGPEPPADRVRMLTLSWSSDGKVLAAPRLQPAGLALIRVEDGRVERTIELACQPCWAPGDPKLAYIRTGAEAGLYILDLRSDVRRLNEAVSDPGRIPGPLWSPDGQTLISFRRTIAESVVDGAKRPTEMLQLVKTRLDGGPVDPAVDLVHDTGREGSLIGAWFSATPEFDEVFYGTAIEDREQSQMTWCRGRVDAVYKRLNPYDEASLLGAFAARPGTSEFALRVRNGGTWSLPAVCDPNTGEFIPIVPDEPSRAEWLARILETMVPLLRDGIPSATLADGTPVERPSLLPAVGEFEEGDTPLGRLRRLAAVARRVLSPKSAALDELRLAFAYLANDNQKPDPDLTRAANDALASLLARAEEPRLRRRLLAVRAQIDLQARDFERAGLLIDYLRSVRPGPTYQIEEGLRRTKLVPIVDRSSYWPVLLAEKLEALKAPAPTDPAHDLVPGNLLNLNGLRPGADAEPAPAPAPGAIPF